MEGFFTEFLLKLGKFCVKWSPNRFSVHWNGQNNRIWVNFDFFEQFQCTEIDFWIQNFYWNGPKVLKNVIFGHFFGRFFLLKRNFFSKFANLLRFSCKIVKFLVSKFFTYLFHVKNWPFLGQLEYEDDIIIKTKGSRQK